MVEAAQWYRKSAEQGDADAQCKLGLCYEDGRGVVKDMVEAEKWKDKAREKWIESDKLYPSLAEWSESRHREFQSPKH